MSDTVIRPEAPGDVAAIHDVNARAFPGGAEARLVDALRDAVTPFISLVAEREGAIIGHLVLTPVEIDDGVRGDDLLLGLGPMAVAPHCQNRGIGSALVRAAIDAARRAGAVAVVVLGHPSYYPRFGFRPAAEHGLLYEPVGPSPAFMALELHQSALRDRSGAVRYHPAFESVDGE